MNVLFSIWPYRLIRIPIGGVFLWSGVAKLMNPESFAVIIDAFGLVPESCVMPISIILPVIEVAAGMGLLLDIRGSLAVTAGMLALFIAILGYGIHMGLDIDCGCFGPEDPEAVAFHGLRPALQRDLAMVFCILYLYAWRHKRSETPVGLRIIINRVLSFPRKAWE